MAALRTRARSSTDVIAASQTNSAAFRRVCSTTVSNVASMRANLPGVALIQGIAGDDAQSASGGFRVEARRAVGAAEHPRMQVGPAHREHPPILVERAPPRNDGVERKHGEPLPASQRVEAADDKTGDGESRPCQIARSQDDAEAAGAHGMRHDYEAECTDR